MKIFQSGLFSRQAKKLHKNEKAALDQEVKKICQDVYIGTQKTGDLKGIFVLKFKTTQYLLSYRFKNGILELIAMGTHKNYYRQVKNYLKSRA